MADQALYQALEEYNQTIANNFKHNWGSLLTYLDGNDTGILTFKANSVQVEERQKIRSQLLKEQQMHAMHAKNSFAARIKGKGPNSVSVRGSKTRDYQTSNVRDAFESNLRSYGGANAAKLLTEQTSQQSVPE